MKFKYRIGTAHGDFWLLLSKEGIHRATWDEHSSKWHEEDFRELDSDQDAQAFSLERGLANKAHAQLDEYFKGAREGFDLPLCPQGSDFQHLVWKELSLIPYGETRSYLDIAKQIGKPGASRAVGSANGKNPLAIFVPCHRVIAANGGLGGYNGGLKAKRALLELEKKGVH